MGRQYLTIHYRSIIDLRAKQGTQYPWISIVGIVRGWTYRRFQQKYDLRGKLFPAGQLKVRNGNGDELITSASDWSDDGIPSYWGMRVVHPCNDYPSTRWWNVDVTINIRDANTITLATTVAYGLRPGFIGEAPPEPLPSVPSFIKKLLDPRSRFTGWAGSLRLVSTPVNIIADDVDECRKQICDPDRMAPIVYISNDQFYNAPYIDPRQLADVLTGSATVFLGSNSDVDESVFSAMPDEFRCTNGTIRVFRPGVKLDDRSNFRRHRFFPGPSLRGSDPKNVIDTLVRGLVKQPQIQLQSPVLDIDDVASMRRRYRLRQLQQQLEDQGDQVSAEWLADYEETLSELDGSRRDVTRLQSEVEELKEDISRLEYEKKEILRASNRMATSEENDLETLRSILKEFPRALQDVLTAVSTLYPDRIHVLQEANNSAEEARFSDTESAWGVLTSMATVLWPLHFREKGVDMQQRFKEQTGYELAITEGSLTKADKSFRHQRERDYSGRVVDITPHVKARSSSSHGKEFLRVHYYADHENEVLVIGHCGDHLDTAGTRRRKE